MSESETGKFIVVFNDDVTEAQINDYVNEVNTQGGEVTQRFNPTLNGFAAKITAAQLHNFQSLQGGIIKYIEPDGKVTIQ